MELKQSKQINQFKSFVNTQHNKRFNISIWFIDGVLTSTITPDQIGPERNDNEEVFYIF